MLLKKITLLLCILTLTSVMYADESKKDDKKIQTSTFSNLKWRSIGPAIASGRIIDFAVNPDDYNEFYVAVASGGVWKTTNKGTTFQPIFDNYGSYSIGCVEIDPNNKNVVWVGTGENNSQRAVSYGDGVYKSIDGGKSFKKMGLETSEHIAKIFIDPRNSDIIFVAAQGPLWRKGGERGLYKSEDGGENWTLVLGPNNPKEISDNTGVSDLVTDPRNPDVMYASTYQRRRHVYTLINGGPEGAVYKSVDAGKTWNKLTNGLPGGLVGRIGLAISPVNPDFVYAIVEASEGRGGFFKSEDRGASWTKKNSKISSSAQYYQEIICHPKDVNTVYSLSTYTSYTTDGGANWTSLGNNERHVDDHALWINPNNPDHFLIGGDGGVYETFDHGKYYRFFENLPITQFYRVTVDNDYPFYNIYGGTQDNNTLGGPARTQNQYGIMNQDWRFTVGGDGFETVVDPKDPNIVYSQPQYGVLVRYDKLSGEITLIKPKEELGEELRWNWNSPVIISPHDHKTLYFAANKLFKTTDRGHSWTKVSEDLTQQIDRNKLEIMDKVWEPEAVAKNASTSLYGNIVSLDESPLKQGLIYVGTDDGLIQVTEDDGKTWRKISSFPTVPETTYVSDIAADLFDEYTVYATFDNRKRADFKSYIIKSTDKGNTWTSISGNMNDEKQLQTVHTFAQDHVNPNLLFIGTEFGVYTSLNGGKEWLKFSNGMPTICIKDLDIQRRENDLAVATFGRSFYIFDDYSPLRTASEELLNNEAHIFPVKDAWNYIQDRSFGRHSLGETFYRAENYKLGAVFTYNYRDNYKTLKSKRVEEYKDDKKTYADYPTWDELREEDNEENPYLIFMIKDKEGNNVRRLTASASAGIKRLHWDLRYNDFSSITEKTDPNTNSAFPVLPGKYSVSMSINEDGIVRELTKPVEFEVKMLENTTLPATDLTALNNFRNEAFEVRKNLSGADLFLKDAKNKLKLYENIVHALPNTSNDMFKDLEAIKKDIFEIDFIMNGDRTKSKRNANQTPSLNNRMGDVLWGFWFSTGKISETNHRVLGILKSEFKKVYSQIKSLDIKLNQMAAELEKAGGPWTPGNIPNID